MVFSYSIWKDCPYNGISKVSYIVFDQDVPIDHCKHVPDPVAQPSTGIEYNVPYTSGMDLAHFRILNNEFLNKDIDVVP